LAVQKSVVLTIQSAARDNKVLCGAAGTLVPDSDSATRLSMKLPISWIVQLASGGYVGAWAVDRIDSPAVNGNNGHARPTAA